MDCSIHISFEMHIRALRMTKKQGHHCSFHGLAFARRDIHSRQRTHSIIYDVTVTFLPARAKRNRCLYLSRARLKKATEEGRP